MGHRIPCEACLLKTLGSRQISRSCQGWCGSAADALNASFTEVIHVASRDANSLCDLAAHRRLTTHWRPSLRHRAGHANGKAFAYVDCENEPGQRTAANLLTRDEARRISVNIAEMPELLKRPQH
jgi:hypothetical protein